MKKQIASALCTLLLTASLPVGAWAQELVLGGQPVGIELQTDGVVVAGFAEVETETGLCSPARDAGLREGDRITELNGREIGEARDLIDALNALPGETAELVVRRGEESETICASVIRPPRIRRVSPLDSSVTPCPSAPYTPLAGS